MRGLAAVLVVVAVLPGCGAERGPRLAVTIESAALFPDAEDAYNPVGRRLWIAYPRVTVRSDRACPGLSVDTRATALFNGNRYSRGRAGETSGGVEFRRRGQGFVGSTWGQVSGDAGTTIQMTAVATCGGSVASDAATFVVPAASCDGGPLRVLALRGRASRWDDNYEGRPVRLRFGDLVGQDSVVRVAPGGRLTIGAPECNGLAVTLFPGASAVGAYEQARRGIAFSGSRVSATGDAHAGGFSTRSALVLPLGVRCRECTPPLPAGYEVRTRRRATTVRVLEGAVLVRVARAEARPVRVGAGFESTVRCARCLPTPPRLYQPGSPGFDAVADSRIRPLSKVVVAERPRPVQIAPHRAQARVTFLRPAGGAPAQLLVEWQRGVRLHGPEVVAQGGLLIWQEGPPHRWRVVYARGRSKFLPLVGTETGDVTRDRHPDVLVGERNGGSGGCGVHRLLATVRGRVRQIFRRSSCETWIRIRAGALVIDEPVGPCPYPQASAHCFGGTKHVVMRWNGHRLVVASSRVKCALPRLDPRAGCTRRH